MAKLSDGALLLIGTDIVGDVTNWEFTFGEGKVVDTTSLASTQEEWLLGLAAPHELSVTLNFDVDNEGQRELLDAKDKRTTRAFTLRVPAAPVAPATTPYREFTFSGKVLGFSMGTAANDKMTGRARIRLTTAVTGIPAPAP